MFANASPMVSLVVAPVSVPRICIVVPSVRMHAVSVLPLAMPLAYGTAVAGPHAQTPNGTDDCVGLAGGLVLVVTGGELECFDADAVGEVRGCPAEWLELAGEGEPLRAGSTA